MNHVVKRDGVTHAVRDAPYAGVITTDARGRVTSESHLAFMLCDLRAKMHATSPNYYTTNPVTCLTCLVRSVL